MRRKLQLILILNAVSLSLCVASAQSEGIAADSVSAPNEVVKDKALIKLLLKNVSEQLHGIHTATYDFARSQFEDLEASYCITSKRSRVLECENPADTNRHAKAIYLDRESGQIMQAYDGKNSYYNRNGEIEKSTPMVSHGVVMTSPPFINQVTSLTDYLLTTDNPRLDMSLEAYDDNWIVDALIDSTSTIVFYGKPVEFVYPNSNSHFRMVVDKKSLLPSRMSYLEYYPRMKFEIACENLEINPFPVDSFSVENYISKLGMPEPKDNVKGRLDWDDYFATIEGKPCPDGVLMTPSLDSATLGQFKGSPLLLMLTIPNCGPCKASYPTICKLLDEYSSDGLRGVCILYADNVDPRSLTSYSKNHKLNFPIWADSEGEVHKYFTQIGAAPMYCIIDKDGIVRDYIFGFDAVFPQKSERKLRKMIEKWL